MTRIVLLHAGFTASETLHPLAKRLGEAMPGAEIICPDLLGHGMEACAPDAGVAVQIARLERLALRQGLDFLRVDPRVTRNDRTLELDVEFVLSKGPRVFIERIDIEGNTTTLDRVVRREFRVVEGDPFNPREISQAARRIQALRYFAQSEVVPRPGSTDDRVIIDVDVVERPTGTLSFGASYSPDSGGGAAISYSEANFLGRGQNVTFSLNTSQDGNSFQGSFTCNEGRELHVVSYQDKRVGSSQSS